MKKTVVIAVAILALTGCAEHRWVKPGATQDEFATDRYECMQEAKHPASGAYVDANVGVASSGIAINPTLFNACMNARGYYYQQGSGEKVWQWLTTPRTQF